MGSATPAPRELADRAAQALGATALAAAAAAATSQRPPAPKLTAVPSRKPAQSTLFEDEAAPATAAAKTSPKRPAPRRGPASDTRGEQTTLDFLPTAPQTVRTLKTTVEAMIYCDAPVAGAMHRGMAAVLDASMVFLAFGIFLAPFLYLGSLFAWNKQNIAVFVGAFALISMFYGFVWMLAGRETPGMQWTDLRVLTFNGFPPDRRQRALRLVACWLSFASGMIGILWALVDEEGLTWHDHMSKTFPTLRETESLLVRT